MESYRIGSKPMIKLPYSEVCMHMRIAGNVMRAHILPDGVQLLNDDGSVFSFPITHGEAGVIAVPADLTSLSADRFNAARAAVTMPSKLETIHTLQAQAIAYVWGWQDAGGDVKDTERSSAFGWAYGTVAALYESGSIGSRPPIQDAWQSFRQHGEIRDYNGRALDQLPVKVTS